MNTTCKRRQLEAEVAATEVPSSDQTQFPSCQVTLTLSSFNRKIILSFSYLFIADITMINSISLLPEIHLSELM